jgi:hypothetical protein
MSEKENLTEKLQVLLSKADSTALNIIIARRAIEQGTKPVPVSEYVRSLIKKDIEINTMGQVSFAEERVAQIISEYKSNQNQNQNA